MSYFHDMKMIPLIVWSVRNSSKKKIVRFHNCLKKIYTFLEIILAVRYISQSAHVTSTVCNNSVSALSDKIKIIQIVHVDLKIDTDSPFDITDIQLSDNVMTLCFWTLSSLSLTNNFLILWSTRDASGRKQMILVNISPDSDDPDQLSIDGDETQKKIIKFTIKQRYEIPSSMKSSE